MKKLFVFVLAIAALVSFNACKKDGVYNPSKKISKIYTDDEGKKVLSEVWSWNKNQLEKIDHMSYSGSISWTESFTYDKKRLVRVDVKEDNEYSLYEYDGKKLDKVTYYDEGEIEREYLLAYDGKKLSKITMRRHYNDDKATKHDVNFLSAIVEEQAATLLVDNLEKLRMRYPNRRKAFEENVLELEWDGKNISKMKTETDEYSVEYSFKYDSKLNPFQGFYGLYYDESLIEVLYNYKNKNNMVEIECTSIDKDDNSKESFSVTVDYTYDGKYPISQTVKFNATNRDTRYFEYE